MAPPSYPKGKCALGSNCQFQQLELRPEHKCIKCNGLLHVFCSIQNDEDDSKLQCKLPCVALAKKPPSKLPPLPPRTTLQSDKPTESSKIIKCGACGRNDHSRRSSKKCPFYISKKSKATPRNNPSDVPSKKLIRTPNLKSQYCLPIETVMDGDVRKEVGIVLGTVVDEVVAKFEGIVSGEKASAGGSDDSVSRPKFISVGDELKDLARYKPVVDIDSSNFKFTNTVFRITSRDYRNRFSYLDPTPSVLVDQFFPESLIQRLVNHSNAYTQECRRRFPHLDVWKRKNDCAPFTISSIFHFFAIIYYTGVVKLPCKDDYWSIDPMMPVHDLCNELGMSRNRFRFLWRFFHCNHPIEDDFEIDNNDADDLELLEGGETIVMEQTLERVQVDQDDDDEEIHHDEPKTKQVSVWFEKLEPFIKHFRDVSEALIFTLGTNLSLDEMMVRFSGRSVETHRIKNKPIGEGFKFFVLSTSEGYVVNFTPDGRRAAKTNQLEYNEDKTLGKIETMTLHVISVIDRLKNSQKERLKNRYNKRSTRSNEIDPYMAENPQKQFILAMDNYFTLPKVIAKLRDKNIGVVGTARFRRNWPCKELRNINLDDVKFNDFFWTVDEHGTLVARWMDNGMVFVVSTVHKPGKIVKRLRKKPRITPNNKKHVQKIWGDKGAVPIFIPRLIDNYNFWMNGVDLTDQRVSYYHPNLRCYRTWMPMKLQVLSMIRNNSYHVHKDGKKESALKHKKFTLEFISELMIRARRFYFDNQHKQSEDYPMINSTLSLASSAASSAASSITTFENNKDKNTSHQANYTSKSFSIPGKSLSSNTRSKRNQAVVLPPKRATKKMKVTTKSVKLSDFDNFRFQPPASNHIRISDFMETISEEGSKITNNSNRKKGKFVSKRERCLYCSIMYHQLKNDEGLVLTTDGKKKNWDQFVKRTVQRCKVCNVHLCDKHFDLFHTKR